MLIQDNKIYYSFKGKLIVDDIVALCEPEFDDLQSITVNTLKDEVEREIIVKSASFLILDFLALNEILQHISTDDELIFPETLVLCEVNELENVKKLNLNENFSIVMLPCLPMLFQVTLKQCFSRAYKRFHVQLQSQKHESLFVNSHQPKLILDLKTGRILDANAAACNLYGKSATEIVKTDMETVHPGSFHLIASQAENAAHGEKDVINLKLFKSRSEIIDLQYNFTKINFGNDQHIFVNAEDNTEKGKAYELYYQQAEMLRNTLDSIDDLLFSLNKDGDFIEYYQPTGGASLTLSSDVFVGKNIYDVGFPLDVARKYIDTIDEVIEEDKPVQIDYYMEAFGTRLWYNAKISPRKNAFGITDGVTVLCRDVTRQKKNEETLKKARDFYLTLLADFPGMIWKTNPGRHADYFNKTWLEFTGKTLEEEIRTDWVEKIHLSDISNFLTVMTNSHRKKEAFQIEHRLLNREGLYRWVINAGRPFYNIEGQFTGFIGSCYDITERRKADELLHLQKSAMESALEGIVIIEDDNGSYPVIYANKEASRLTGNTVEEILNQNFIQMLGCPQSKTLNEQLINALKEKKSFKGELCSLSDPDSDQKQWRLLYLAPVKDKNHVTNHFVAILSDITETKIVEQTLREKNKQLRKTNEELDSFVYSTSHELRSPLMSVLGLLNLLESDIGQEERDSYVGMIRESISRLDKIIHDIIDYSRNARIDLAYERINFTSMIENIISNNTYLDNFDQIRFELNIQDEHAFLSDKKRIQIILNNLISNAIRFHNFDQPDPYVQISVVTSPVNSVINVTDNGTGIQEKHLPKIYNMFYRGTQKSKGSGIGLYIVKEIVDKLKGYIQLNTVFGQGATFTIDIPNYLNKNYNILTLNNAESSVE